MTKKKISEIFVYRCDVCRKRISTTKALDLRLTSHSGAAASIGQHVSCIGGLSCIDIMRKTNAL